MAVERGNRAKARRVVALQARDSILEHVANLPKLGAFVHVLVEPFFADGQMELLDQKDLKRDKALCKNCKDMKLVEPNTRSRSSMPRVRKFKENAGKKGCYGVRMIKDFGKRVFVGEQ
ncbi:2-succinyl-5-enolpyruvyl-6-hydroxy-3-cyclohexene-1-carboxylate synthase [Striga asiatica]|uniref:2-succinyl-5-enolpyruvyl-6-hydroxy-3-cyclohexene-1-carboxylate synthase n=1 Tax=Striga asiatica TaxID=4170 RepID=A0A5A7Q0N2_STRAF|nr:2-succinyl-5-enolpyruvyl-6-hydroxy-3-cyclohexene-1-carboxylate synthase [Striga asiatica]